MKKRETLKNRFALALAALFIALAPQVLMAKTARETANDAGTSYAQLSKQVRKRLASLPYYGVFDNLAYSIEGGQVTLHGEVVRPSTRSDAERSVRRIAGV